MSAAFSPAERFAKAWGGAIFGPVPFCNPRSRLSKNCRQEGPRSESKWPKLGHSTAPRMDPAGDAIGCNHPKNEIIRLKQDNQFPALLRPRFPGFKLSPRRRPLSALRDEVNDHSAPEEHRMRQIQEDLTRSAKKPKRVEENDIQTTRTDITSDFSFTEVISEELSSDVHYQEAPPTNAYLSSEPASLEAPSLLQAPSEALPSQGVSSCQEPKRQTRDLEAAHILQALSSGAPPKYVPPRKQSATLRLNGGLKVFTEGELIADSKNQPGAYGRSGKWTPEEEEFSRAIVKFFCMGLIDLPDGSTLRSYLSKKLSCDPMRVTKKFSSGLEEPIGKKVYRRQNFEHVDAAEVANAQRRMEILERLFKTSLSKASSPQLRNLCELQTFEKQELIRRQRDEKRALHAKLLDDSAAEGLSDLLALKDNPGLCN